MDTPHVASQVACVYPPSPDLLCPADSDNASSLVGGNSTLDNGTFYYQLVLEGVYSCNVSDGFQGDVFEIRTCSFGNVQTVNTSSSGNVLPYQVGERESGVTLNVSTEMPDIMVRVRLEMG